MSVEFQNYDHSYGDKPIFSPNELGRRIGEDIKAQIEGAYKFDSFIYHLRKNGGHVAALHAHREHQFFARVDIRRFFYSIARNRVRRALSAIGIDRALHYAKWSCVKNPHGEPAYSLPYGFIQSPILATLVLMESGVGRFLRVLEQQGHVKVTVYMDDISLSSNDLPLLKAAFEQLLTKLDESEFQISPNKVREPSPAMDVFNCDMKSGRTTVRDDRVALFHSEDRVEASTNAFERYCQSVEEGNA
ncbi:MAG: reverse transcriptase domain-containing protein [Sphingomicrobium sp.]